MAEEKITGEAVNYQVMKRIIGLAKPFKWQFIAATAMAIILAILAPARPMLIQMTVDDYVLKYDFQGLVFMTCLMVGVLMAESLFRYFFIYITNWLGQSVIKNLRVRVFDHVLHLKTQYFDKTPIGTATTRTINDVEVINDIFSQGLIQIIADLLTIVVIIVVMFWYDWRLTLVTLSTFPVLLYSTYLFKEGIKKSFQTVRTKVAQLNAFLQEHITGMRIIQIFNAEDSEMKKFKKINQDHRDAHVRSIWYYSVFFPAVEIILATAIGLVVWYGSSKMLVSTTSPGVLITFIMFVNLLFRPLRMLADKFNTLQMGVVAASRVFVLLDRAEHIENKGTLTPKRVKGSIEFDKVWFAYNDDNYVLRDISFDVKAGDTLAIVGATGSGKSSTINILNRFYEIQKGSIKVDDTDIKEYDLYSLRCRIGMVLQDVFLFGGTVMENITLRDTNITRKQVIDAAKMVGAHDFIMNLPGNYDYQVMERGATLSMGQRQLISFIRALVFDPDILILDEATSSIDTESEMIIQHAIEKLITNRTSIVIAHRLSTIQNASKIMVLDNGEIKEIGTHHELLEKGGYYKRLYDMQFKQSMAG